MSNNHSKSSLSRRTFLKTSAVATGTAATIGGNVLASQSLNAFPSVHCEKVLSDAFDDAEWDSTLTIFLTGGFSHLDAWCHRPVLESSDHSGINWGSPGKSLLPPVAPYRSVGVSGELKISSLMPNLAGQADQMLLIHGVQASSVHHGNSAKDWSELTGLHCQSLLGKKDSDLAQTLSQKDWFGLQDSATAKTGAKIQDALYAIHSGLKHQTVRVNGPGLDGWDAHRDLQENCRQGFRSLDKPLAGLLEIASVVPAFRRTLILCISEFGRSPFREDPSGHGRGHYAEAFTIWVAGAGVRGGRMVGKVNPIGLAEEGCQLPARSIAQFVAGNTRKSIWL